jgi:hypothetical protein
VSVVIGIDADARRLAYAVVQGGRLRAVCLITRSEPNGTIHGRYDQLLTALMMKARAEDGVIYLEDIYLDDRKGKGGPNKHFHGSTTGFKHLAEVQGEIKREARRFGVPVVSVKAVTWYSKVLGFTKDRAKLKAASMEKATATARSIGVRGLSEHEADAVNIALYGALKEEPWRQSV